MTSLLEPTAALSINLFFAAFSSILLEASGWVSVAVFTGVFVALTAIELFVLALYFRSLEKR